MTVADKMFRRLIAPFLLRFKDTDGLIEALTFLERGRDRHVVSQAEIDTAMLLIARELIRRRVVFWVLFFLA